MGKRLLAQISPAHPNQTLLIKSEVDPLTLKTTMKVRILPDIKIRTETSTTVVTTGLLYLWEHLQITLAFVCVCVVYHTYIHTLVCNLTVVKIANF